MLKIVGAMKMKDEGETDTKLIAVHTDDYKHEKLNEITDIPKEFLEEIKSFFLTYKKHKGDVIEINGFKDSSWAWNEYKECLKLYQKYSSMPKNNFIETMKKKTPWKILKIKKFILIF